MSWLQGADPVPGDPRSCDAIEHVIVPRARDLGGFEVRRALPSAQEAHDRPVHLLRPHGPRRFPARQRHRRPPPPAYRAGDGDLPVRRRNVAPRQPRHRAGDLARRGQPYDRGARNRAFRARRRRSATADPSHCSASKPGSRCRTRTRSRAWGSLMPAQTSLPLHRGRGQARPVDHGRDCTAYLAGRDFPRYELLCRSRPGARRRAAPRSGLRRARRFTSPSGEIDIAGERFEPGRLLVFKPGDRILDHGAVQRAVDAAGGEPMDGPRHIWWNFVSSRKDRIDQAKEDWKQGRFGLVPGDELEFIPLPER